MNRQQPNITQEDTHKNGAAASSTRMTTTTAIRPLHREGERIEFTGDSSGDSLWLLSCTSLDIGATGRKSEAKGDRSNFKMKKTHRKGQQKTARFSEMKPDDNERHRESVSSTDYAEVLSTSKNNNQTTAEKKESSPSDKKDDSSSIGDRNKSLFRRLSSFDDEVHLLGGFADLMASFDFDDAVADEEERDGPTRLTI